MDDDDGDVSSFIFLAFLKMNPSRFGSVAVPCVASYVRF